MWLAACAVSVVAAGGWERWWGEAYSLAKGMIICLVVVALIWTRESLRRTQITLLVVGAIMGGFTVHQFTTESWQLSYFGLGNFRLQGMAGTVERHRASGPIGDPNFYAQFLLVLIALAIERVWNERSRAVSVLAATALFGLTAALAFTYSRGGYLAFAFLILLSALIATVWKPPLRRVLLSVALVAAALPLGGDTALHRLSTIGHLLQPQKGSTPADPESDSRTEAEQRFGRILDDYGFPGRVSENLSALMMFADHPIVGVGSGGFGLHYAEYADRIGIDQRPMRAAHNLYLEVAAETGCVGIAAFIFLLASLFVGVAKTYRHLVAAGEVDLGRSVAGLGMALVAYLLAASTLHLGYHTIFWLLVGIIFGAANLSPTADSSE